MKVLMLLTPVQSDESLQKMLDHQKMPPALSPCHEQVETFQTQSGIYELPASENNDWSTHRKYIILSTKRKLDWFTHFHTTMQQSHHCLQWDVQIHPQNYPFLFDNHHSHLIHTSPDQPVTRYSSCASSFVEFNPKKTVNKTNNSITNRDWQLYYSVSPK